jgi:hypothetical protein
MNCLKATFYCPWGSRRKNYHHATGEKCFAGYLVRFVDQHKRLHLFSASAGEIIPQQLRSHKNAVAQPNVNAVTLRSTFSATGVQTETDRLYPDAAKLCRLCGQADHRRRLIRAIPKMFETLVNTI